MSGKHCFLACWGPVAFRHIADGDKGITVRNRAQPRHLWPPLRRFYRTWHQRLGQRHQEPHAVLDMHELRRFRLQIDRLLVIKAGDFHDPDDSATVGNQRQNRLERDRVDDRLDQERKCRLTDRGRRRGHGDQVPAASAVPSAHQRGERAEVYLGLGRANGLEQRPREVSSASLVTISSSLIMIFWAHDFLRPLSAAGRHCPVS